MTSQQSWRTENEIDYINSLVSGSYCYQTQHVRKIRTSSLIANYIRSATKRKEWGTFGFVDPDVVIDHAKQLYAKQID